MFRLVVACLAALALFTPPSVSVRASNVAAQLVLIGEVRSIHVGLGVQPPGEHIKAGRVPQSLYQRYRLLTNQNELASMIFRDRSVLHVNHDTDLTLRTSSVTFVKRGQVDQVVTPGTSHSVQTGSAIASAVGSDFLVDTSPTGTLVATREGSVLVYNQFGYVYVKTGQATRVTGSAPPSAPSSYNVAGALTWRNQLQPAAPPLDTNLVLDANGGHVLAASSEQSSMPGERAAPAAYAIDGRLDRGWATQLGHPTNQSITLGFHTTDTYLISAVAISTAPFGNHSPLQDLRHFAIRASTTDTAAASFKSVYSGTVKKEVGLQRFQLSKPFLARYVQLYVSDNYGDPHQTVVTEIEAIGHVSPDGSTQQATSCVLAHPCMQALLQLINSDRAQGHVRQLQLDEALSSGDNTCVGAYGHSSYMALTNSVWHQNPRYPNASWPHDVCAQVKPNKYNTAENIGLEETGDEMQDLTAIHKLWMSEPHDPQTCAKTFAHDLNNHACNILNPAYSRAGVGLYFDGKWTWITVIFIP